MEINEEVLFLCNTDHLRNRRLLIANDLSAFADSG